MIIRIESRKQIRLISITVPITIKMKKNLEPRKDKHRKAFPVLVVAAAQKGGCQVIAQQGTGQEVNKRVLRPAGEAPARLEIGLGKRAGNGQEQDPET
jgi:hypothetical protein